MPLTFAHLNDTPIGPLSFFAGDHGLQGVAFSSLTQLKQKLLNPDDGPSFQGLETLGTLLVEVNAYLFGLQRVFTVDIDWDIIEGFQREVLALTAEIPYGKVVTYGEIAEKLGKPGAARAVGSALARNPMPIVIPCHRVIGADRVLRGYIGGEDTKAFLLRLEGQTITGTPLMIR